MEIKTLYRFEREYGKVTVSPNKPDVPFEETYRVVAGEGKLVTLNGEESYSVIDTDIKEGWYEIDAPEIIMEDPLEDRFGGF